MNVSFEVLLEKYLNNELEPRQLKSFLDAVKSQENQQKLQQALDEKLRQKPALCKTDETELELMFEKVLRKASLDWGAAKEEQDRKSPLVVRMRYNLLARIAAAVVLVLGSAAYLLMNDNPGTKQPVTPQTSTIANDVNPGTNKAVLTLANGSTIVLEKNLDGTIARQGSTSIVQVAVGQLAYKTEATSGPSIGYNLLTTPPGGQYEVILPDETHVWLNASSSLKFPTSFEGNERSVQLTGEAYFEVAHNSKKPFNVVVDDMKVHVLGTHFNINAYADEGVRKSTLLQGSIRISNKTEAITMKQGQQVKLGDDGNMQVVSEPDLDEVIAWKKGLFSFNQADLPTIMRQFARWYDIKIRYEGKPSSRRFSGEVFRNLKLSEALRILELNDVHVKIEGKTLTVIQ